MGVVQKGPNLTLFCGPQKTSFFRLFSTFSGFFQKKRNRPTDATFDKNRSKKGSIKKRSKIVKKSKIKKRSTKKKTIQKKLKIENRPKNTKIDPISQIG